VRTGANLDLVDDRLGRGTWEEARLSGPHVRSRPNERTARLPSFGKTADGRRSPGLIAIVDDDDDIRDALRTLLEEEGYQTIEATDGTDALAMLAGAAVKPDVVLLDLMMPMMDGWQLRARLREEPTLAGIPIVIMTAHLALRRAVSEAEPGLDVLPKPLDVDRLLEIIHGRCGDKRSGMQ
jgi:CheY-like chemotaxis protein